VDVPSIFLGYIITEEYILIYLSVRLIKEYAFIFLDKYMSIYSSALYSSIFFSVN
jgi:hypothetical protein